MPASLVGGPLRAAKLSDQLEAWLKSHQEKTLGGLVATFEDKSFAMLFVLLLAVPALPLPTGGATHVMEIIAGLLALELIAGRRETPCGRRDRCWLHRRHRRRPRGAETAQTGRLQGSPDPRRTGHRSCSVET